MAVDDDGRRQDSPADPVTIHFCRLCGFGKQAEAIAGAIRKELGLATELHEAFWGTFRVELGGSEVYNRRRTRGWLGLLGLGRMPAAEEVVGMLRQRPPTAAD